MNLSDPDNKKAKEKSKNKKEKKEKSILNKIFGGKNAGSSTK